MRFNFSKNLEISRLSDNRVISFLIRLIIEIWIMIIDQEFYKRYPEFMRKFSKITALIQETDYSFTRDLDENILIGSGMLRSSRLQKRLDALQKRKNTLKRIAQHKEMFILS